MHVGIVRSPHGNSSCILDRIAAHRKTIFGLLQTGLALSHRANPFASARLDQIYATLVLMSGLATLLLSAKEEKILSHHYKVHLQRIFRFHDSTPAPVVYLVAGRPPFLCQLHLKIISIFGQICRYRDGDNFLARHAIYVYKISKSELPWFLSLPCCIQTLWIFPI